MLTLAPYSPVYFIAIVAYLIFREKVVHKKLTMRQQWVLCLPATFMHEFAHWAAGGLCESV